MVKRKVSSLCPGTRTPDHPAGSPALYHLAIPAPALTIIVINNNFVMRDITELKVKLYGSKWRFFRLQMV
jgi:hypothetical protein